MTTPAPAHRAPGALIHGNSVANAVARRIPVQWELNLATQVVTANGQQVGRVIESLPGKLYYFQSPAEAAAGDMWGSFPSLASAAEHGAIRAFL